LYSSIGANFASFCWLSFFIPIRNFTTKMFKILYLLQTFVIHYDFTSCWVLSVPLT
jgi:hypothetical protein